MIQANELRIGNYISRLDLGDNSERTEKIIELGKKALTTGPINVYCQYNEIQPIQLTYDWLEKFRFIRFRESKCYFKIYYFNREERKLNIEGDVGFSISVEYEDKFAMISFIQYVHQLQNIYFSLTGEELVLQTV